MLNKIKEIKTWFKETKRDINNLHKFREDMSVIVEDETNQDEYLANLGISDETYRINFDRENDILYAQYVLPNTYQQTTVDIREKEAMRVFKPLIYFVLAELGYEGYVDYELITFMDEEGNTSLCYGITLSFNKRLASKWNKWKYYGSIVGLSILGLVIVSGLIFGGYVLISTLF